VDKKVASKEWTLFKRVIDSEDGFGNDVLVVNIGGDAMMRCGAPLIPGANCRTGSVQWTCRLTAS